MTHIRSWDEKKFDILEYTMKVLEEYDPNEPIPPAGICATEMAIRENQRQMNHGIIYNSLSQGNK